MVTLVILTLFLDFFYFLLTSLLYFGFTWLFNLLQLLFAKPFSAKILPSICHCLNPFSIWYTYRSFKILELWFYCFGWGDLAQWRKQLSKMQAYSTFISDKFASKVSFFYYCQCDPIFVCRFLERFQPKPCIVTLRLETSGSFQLEETFGKQHFQLDLR